MSPWMLTRTSLTGKRRSMRQKRLKLALIDTEDRNLHTGLQFEARLLTSSC